MRYRVITNGISYVVQRRFLWFWWLSLDIADEFSNYPYEFDTIEAARQWIEASQADEVIRRTPWKVV